MGVHVQGTENWKSGAFRPGPAGCYGAQKGGHLAACDACQFLQSTLADVAPHPALILVEIETHRDDAQRKSGGYFRFVCEDCGTMLVKDFSDSKRRAGWTFLVPV